MKRPKRQPAAPGSKPTSMFVTLQGGLQRLSEAYVAFSALQAANKAQGAGSKVVMDLLK